MKKTRSPPYRKQKMKLTKQTLRRIIKEELEAVMNEVRLEPDHSYFASDDQITKIRTLLDSGDPESINMAKTLLDALGADPSYFDDYMQNQEVGDLEKLGNQHADMHQRVTFSDDPRGTIYKGLKPGLTGEDARRIDREADALLDKKFARMNPDADEDDYPPHSLQDRYYDTRNIDDSRFQDSTGRNRKTIGHVSQKPVVKKNSRS